MGGGAGRGGEEGRREEGRIQLGGIFVSGMVEHNSPSLWTIIQHNTSSFLHLKLHWQRLSLRKFLR